MFSLSSAKNTWWATLNLIFRWPSCSLQPDFKWIHQVVALKHNIAFKVDSVFDTSSSSAAFHCRRYPRKSHVKPFVQPAQPSRWLHHSIWFCSFAVDLLVEEVMWGLETEVRGHLILRSLWLVWKSRLRRPLRSRDGSVDLSSFAWTALPRYSCSQQDVSDGRLTFLPELLKRSTRIVGLSEMPRQTLDGAPWVLAPTVASSSGWVVITLLIPRLCFWRR